MSIQMKVLAVIWAVDSLPFSWGQREQSTWSLTLAQGPGRSQGLNEYPHKSLWRALMVPYWATNLVWGQPRYMVQAVPWPALARRNSPGPSRWSSRSSQAPLPVRPFPVGKGATRVVFDSCTGSRQVPWTHWLSTQAPMKGFKGGCLTGSPMSEASPCTWFRPFTGLLLPGGTPQVHPGEAPGRSMRRCQSELFLWTREQPTWSLTRVQGPGWSHGLTGYPHMFLWRVLRVFYWVTLVCGQPRYMVQAIHRPALARRDPTVGRVTQDKSQKLKNGISYSHVVW